MDLKLNDRVELKKPHPCGCKQFLVTRAGMDFKIQCQKCGHLIEIPRLKAEKNIKRALREEPAQE